MHVKSTRGVGCAFFLVALLLPACGGSGGDGGGGQTGGDPPLSFSLTGVQPAVVAGITGGETVTLTGSNFLGVNIAQINFGGLQAVTIAVRDDEIDVFIPPAPSGGTEIVDVTVMTSDAGDESLTGVFRYQGPPAPQGVNPGATPPTAMLEVTITGADLGLPSDTTVKVDFDGLEVVTGTVVGADVTVQVPLPPGGVPPSTPITLTVENSAGQKGSLGGNFFFDWATPLFIPIPGQSTGLGGASEPVRLAEGSVVFCNAGNNGTWMDNDDDVFLITGLPNAPNLTRLMRPTTPPTSIGYLHPSHSHIAALDADTICVYSTGTDGAVRTALDRVTLIDGIGTTVAVADHAAPFLIEAPLARVSFNSVAFCMAGTDSTYGTTDDLLMVMRFNLLAPSAIGIGIVGPIDSGAATGTSISGPIVADSDTILVRNVGANGTPADADDLLLRATSVLGNPMTIRAATAPNVIQTPIILAGAGLAVVPSSGGNGTVGDSDDALEVYNLTASNLVRTTLTVSPGFNAAAVTTAVGLGSSGVVVAINGANVRVYTDVGAGTLSDVAIMGVPAFVSLGGEVLIYGPGIDLTPGTGDDVAVRIADTGTPTSFADAPMWGQALPPTTDGNRAFAVGAGPDGAAGTGDEQIIVHVPAALGRTRDAVALPLSPAGFVINPVYPVTAFGVNYGVMQQPGSNILVVVRF